VSRRGKDANMGRNNTDEVWHLHCDGKEWIGEHEECGHTTSKAPGIIFNTRLQIRDRFIFII